MKLFIITIFAIIFISKDAFSSEDNTKPCSKNEIEISLIEYSYCESKNNVDKFEVINGSNPTLYIKTHNHEFSFAKLPISLALLDIPKKLNMSLSDFFDKIINRDFKKGKFTKIRQAFEVNENTILVKYKKINFNAVSIINKNAITNSIYIYEDNDKFLYLIKGDFSKIFSDKFMSKLRSRS